jgi:hypothetical protein
MIVTYSPAGEEPQVWTWSPGKVLAKDAESIEDSFEGTWDEFNVQLLQGRMRARRVLLWHLQSQDHPTIKLDDINFPAEALVLDMEPAELAEMRRGIETTSGLSTSKRRQALALLDEEITKAGGAPGKARSRKSASSTR